jgi:hypothetical protein
MAEPAGASPALDLALDLAPLDRALARMASELDEYTRRRDGRQIFLFAYHFLSTEMRRNLTGGRFADPRWMTALAGRFADAYFDAAEAFEQRKPCPEPWAVYFRVAREWRASPMEILLLGMNAHIVHDLPFTIAEALRREDRTAPRFALRKFDHEMVNEVLEQAIDPFQDRFAARYAPWLRVVDELLWRADEWLSDRMLRATRDDVWTHATALAAAATPAEEAAVARHVVSCALANAAKIDVVNALPMPRVIRRLVRRFRREF